MAGISQKDKLIEEAQKFVQRGQLDKALKSYEQLLALDGSAINHRQKFADLLVKANRPDDARSQLEILGKHFSNNGFYLKAIAVYKQIQKLFPSDISTTLVLAGLNEKHGLIANALAEYKQVYEFHEKAGNPQEALKVLDLMQAVDPQNANIRIKLAEAHFQQGRQEDAYAHFTRAASLLQERHDNASLAKLTARIQQLFPAKSKFMLEVLADQIASGNAANAVNGLQAMLRSDPKDKRVWLLTVKAYEQLGEPQRLKVAYQHFLKFFPDEPVAMVGVLRQCVADGDVGAGLGLLERNEEKLRLAGQAAVVLEAYQAFDKVEPVNTRLLQGWQRFCRALGNDDEAATIGARLDSLLNLSAASRVPEGLLEAADGVDEDVPEWSPTAEVASEMLLGEEPAPGGLEALPEEEEIEIEIDVDMDVDFDAAAEGEPAEEGDDWLDSVDVLFEGIETAPHGVKIGNEMDSADAQSHYDLGLAFKEMGLYAEAINEFRAAGQDPLRRIDCLILQGGCLREHGELAAAENVFRSLLKHRLDLEDLCAAKYELALTCAASGTAEEAAALFADIDRINPGFRDVSARLDAETDEASLDFSEDDLKGFDL